MAGNAPLGPVLRSPNPDKSPQFKTLRCLSVIALIGTRLASALSEIWPELYHDVRQDRYDKGGHWPVKAAVCFS
jgi:hypothetical protein